MKLRGSHDIQILISFGLLLCIPKAWAQQVDYGIDVSYPAHHHNVSTNYDWLPWNVDPNIPTPEEYVDMPVQPLGEKQKYYEWMIRRCVEYYGSKGKRCLDNEIGRIKMNLRQPQSMINFTDTGFLKLRMPDRSFKPLREFWDAHRDKAVSEKWPIGNTYVNHWDHESYMVSVEDKKLEGSGYVLKSHIWNSVRTAIQEWTNQNVVECSLYGIRVYEEGAMLAPHLDRLPLVLSAIINVDQDLDEPWPLELIGHDGKAHNVTMMPGDMLIYEGHSVIHGRPFPLKGKFMANVFVHFEPYGIISKRRVFSGDLPPYIIPGSLEEKNWKSKNPHGWKATEHSEFMTGTTEAHQSVIKANLESLEQVLNVNEHYVNAKDENGWTPLHEAVRLRSDKGPEVVKLLVDRGADVNALTRDGKSPLWLSKFYLKDNPIIDLMEGFGAKLIGPEL